MLMFDVRGIGGCAFLASAKTSFVGHERFLEHIKEVFVVHHCNRSYMAVS